MANYCVTKYWIEGDHKVLRKLAALIGEGKYVNDILPQMGMPLSEVSFREEGSPYWYNAKLKENVLRFVEEAKWEQSLCLWNLQNRKDSGLGEIYYYSAVTESDLCHTNDAEGKYFPYRITAFCDEIQTGEEPHLYIVSEDNTFLFKSQEDMLSFFERTRGWKASDEEELRCAAEKGGFYLYTSEIATVSGPMHLGINKMKFDFRKGEDGHIDVVICQ